MKDGTANTQRILLNTLRYQSGSGPRVGREDKDAREGGDEGEAEDEGGAKGEREGVDEEVGVGINLDVVDAENRHLMTLGEFLDGLLEQWIAKRWSD